MRYVKFDSLGHTLITGIANLGPGHGAHHQHLGASVAAEPHRVTSRNYYAGAHTASQYEQRRSRIMSRYERVMQQYRNVTGGIGVGSASSADPFDTYISRRLLSQSLNTGSTADRSTDPMAPSSSQAPEANSSSPLYPNVHPFPSILRYMGTSGESMLEPYLFSRECVRNIYYKPVISESGPSRLTCTLRCSR